MPVLRARRFAALLLAAGLALVLASGMAACAGASDNAPASAPTGSAPPTAAPAEPPAPVESPAETTQTPIATPDPPTSLAESPPAPAPAPEPPAAPVEPPAPDSSTPLAEPTETSATPFLYDTYDLSGTVAEPGHYTFLEDPDDPSSVVSTYEELRDGTATALLIHTHDAHGASQAAHYDAVEPGDLFEWRQAPDCFVRYAVNAVEDDPAGDPPRKLLAVAWMTYAFTGCSGTIATTTAATLDWADLPDLGGTSLTTPIVHGAFQIVPAGWEGVVEETFLQPPPQATRDTLETIQTTWMAPAGTLARAAELPYWRTPALPDTWTFTGAGLSRDVVPYGYIAEWTGPGGSGHLVIDGTHAQVRRWPQESHHDLGNGEIGVRETRVIAGRPAYVSYTPDPNDPSVFFSILYIYDPAAEAQYRLAMLAGDAPFPDTESLIALVATLFEPPNAP